MFEKRSTRLERIDTGDHTPDEYAVFLKEIRSINRFLGDVRALRRTLLSEIEANDIREFSVLDVGSGSGELLRTIADLARRSGRKVRLTGIDLNELSIAATASSIEFPEISAVRGNAFRLPFADGAFDYAISSLFFHHLTDEQIPAALEEMLRVARGGVFVIDLHRHPVAYFAFWAFCKTFGISQLVTEDGLLSIKRGFRPEELNLLCSLPGRGSAQIKRVFPFRIVVSRTEPKL